MGILASELCKYVIRPTLNYIDLWSLSAEKLLLGTAAHESRLGRYLHQTNGPALGIFQIEPNTHHDIWVNYLKYKSELSYKISNLLLKGYENQDDYNLIVNLSYATAIARIVYLRAKEPLPQDDDVDGLARYWKRHYNTSLGKGRVDDFVKTYKELL